MIGANDTVDAAKVAQAASALIDKYGGEALKHALRLERGSATRRFAAAVTTEVEKRLGQGAGGE